MTGKYVITEEGNNLRITLNNRTKYANKLNDYKYINQKDKYELKFLHPNDNWKRLGRVALDYILVNIEDRTLKQDDYTFYFLTDTGNYLIIQLPKLNEDLFTTMLNATDLQYFFLDLRYGQRYGNTCFNLVNFINLVLYDISSTGILKEYLPDGRIVLEEIGKLGNRPVQYFKILDEALTDNVSSGTAVVSVDNTAETTWHITDKNERLYAVIGGGGTSVTGGTEHSIHIEYTGGEQYKDTKFNSVIFVPDEPAPEPEQENGG